MAVIFRYMPYVKYVFILRTEMKIHTMHGLVFVYVCSYTYIYLFTVHKNNIQWCVFVPVNVKCNCLPLSFVSFVGCICYYIIRFWHLCFCCNNCHVFEMSSNMRNICNIYAIHAHISNNHVFISTHTHMY